MKKLSVVVCILNEENRLDDCLLSIVKNLVAIKQRKIKEFTLGNIDIEKDWGYAKDYVCGMYLMAQQNIPQDYILSSGRMYSLNEFIEITAEKLNIKDWKKYIDIDNSIITRKNNTKLFGDCSLAKKQLNWNRRCGSLDEIIEIMIKNELNGELE